MSTINSNPQLAAIAAPKAAATPQSAVPTAKDDGDIDGASSAAKAAPQGTGGSNAAAANAAVSLNLSPAAKAIVDGSTPQPATLTTGGA